MGDFFYDFFFLGGGGGGRGGGCFLFVCLFGGSGGEGGRCLKNKFFLRRTDLSEVRLLCYGVISCLLNTVARFSIAVSVSVSLSLSLCYYVRKTAMDAATSVKDSRLH